MLDDSVVVTTEGPSLDKASSGIIFDVVVLEIKVVVGTTITVLSVPEFSAVVDEVPLSMTGGISCGGGTRSDTAGVLVTAPNNFGFLIAKANQSNLISNGAGLFITITNPLEVALETIYLMSLFNILSSKAVVVDASSVVEAKDIVTWITGLSKYSLSKVIATSFVPEATMA